MRKKIVAGNWKMNTSMQEGIQLIKEITELLHTVDTRKVSLIVAPPFTHLGEIGKMTKHTEIGLSAQNCSSEPKGAFTGEVSAEMISSVGARYVIIGHSERREHFSETDGILNKKVKQALSNSLVPIFCCGELLSEREEGIYFSIVENQVKKALFDLPEGEFTKLIIAYEPVWAIGTGRTASPQQAQEVHQFIRNLIKDTYGGGISKKMPVLYGGSCKPSNAKELFSQDDVDGGLIGGASLVASDFISIANSFQ